MAADVVVPDPHVRPMLAWCARDLSRTLAVGALAGLIAGFFAGGVGSRIAMRIAGIATSVRFRNIPTEAEATIGEITADGTIFLLFAGSVGGVAGGVLYVATARWLPAPATWKGLLFGTLLLMVGGTALIDGENPDFQTFGPKLLNITMFASLPVLFGLLVAPLSVRLERVVPPPSFSPPTLALYGVLALLSTPGTLASAPAPLALPLLVVGYLLVVDVADRVRAAGNPWRRILLLSGYPVIGIPSIVGLLALIRNIRQIYDFPF